MKKLISIAAVLAASISSYAQYGYTIKGHLNHVPATGRVALHYMADGRLYTDTTLLVNGEFKITGNALKQPVKATLTLIPLQANDRPLTLADYRAMDWQDFYLEKGTISVGGDMLKTALIHGGKTQEEYLLLKAQLQPFEKEIQPLVDENVRYIRSGKRSWRRGLRLSMMK